MKIFGVEISRDAVEAIEQAMWHELADPRGFTWYNHVASRAVVFEGFPSLHVAGRSVAAQAAVRALKQARRAGKIRHIGGGKWAQV